MLRIHSEKYSHHRHGTRLFLLSRCLRIWPLFALVTLATFLLTGMLLGVWRGQDLPHALPLLGVASFGHDLITVTWSLNIALQFYLLLPLLAWVLPRERLWISLLILTTLSLVGFWLHVAGYLVTALFYLPMFGARMLIWRGAYAPARCVAMLSAVSFCLLLALIALSPWGRGLILHSLHLNPGEKVLLMGWVLLLVPFVAWNVRQPSGRLDRFLGDLSFPLYLVHWPTIALLKPLWGGQPGLGGKALTLLVILAVTLALYALVDRPLERRRKRTVGV